MFVAASTTCFPDFSFPEAIEKLYDLEFTSIELHIHEDGAITPRMALEDPARAVTESHATRRLDVCSYLVDISAEGDEYYRQFEACCKLAKASQVITLVVPSAELGTPFNEEVERFKELVKIADAQGVRVAMKSQHGRLSGDPDTVQVVCNHIDGLGLAYDPSQYIYQCDRRLDHEKLLNYAIHVYLRDTTAQELQVQVGQGVIEYGKLVAQLTKLNYKRALCVQIVPQPGIDHFAELRKLRLLLESLLI